MKSLIRDIRKLKKEKKAVILAHNYQLPEVQDVADFVGDSLGLSMAVSRTDAAVIVFCGVFFMAETAKILSPHKVVLIPEKDAGCPMADMITAPQLRELKRLHPGVPVLCYVNTSAAVKAECDYCCTSTNAVKVVQEGLKSAAEVIFVPDQHLAHYVSSQTGKQFIVWPGYCPVHARIERERVLELRKHHPGAEILVHPECKSDVVAAADRVLSTEGMCRYVKDSSSREFIVVTEVGILYRLGKENPDKSFYALGEAVCEDMKKINLEKILWALESMEYQVELPESIIEGARQSIERMLQFA